jgi:Cysteine rich repeat
MQSGWEGKQMPKHRFKISIVSVIVLLTASTDATAQMKEVMRYCKPDAQRLCPGVPPGGGRIAQCLKAHKMEMSIGCGMALRRLKGEIGM